MHDVFISYKTDDGIDFAGRIKDHLILAGYDPFFSAETMRSGRFDTQLEKRVAECTHVLFIVSPKGMRSWWSSRDWSRIEFELAVKNKKHIIPVFMPGVALPRFLPKSLRLLRRLQNVQAVNGAFDKTMGTIIDYLQDKEWEQRDDHTSPPSSEANPDDGYKHLRNGLCIAAVVAVLFVGILLLNQWRALIDPQHAGDGTLPTATDSDSPNAHETPSPVAECDQALPSLGYRSLDLTMTDTDRTI